jgi:hypothetical protein
MYFKTPYKEVVPQEQPFFFAVRINANSSLFLIYM